MCIRDSLLFWLLIIVGIYFTVRTKFVQIRLLPEGIRVLTEKSHEGGISSFQALMIATASRVGTGNISGVATAIVLGGPGAVPVSYTHLKGSKESFRGAISKR